MKGSVDSDDPWYHFVYDERWRIVAVYRADTTTDDLDDDPKEHFIYPATNPVDIAGVVLTCERRRLIGIRGGTGLDGWRSGSYIDAVILHARDANATGDWADGTLEERARRE